MRWLYLEEKATLSYSLWVQLLWFCYRLPSESWMQDQLHKMNINFAPANKRRYICGHEEV
jgi:hypothetical protein